MSSGPRTLGGRLMSINDGTSTTLAVLDRHGDLTARVNVDGTAAATSLYDPFGDPAGQTGTSVDVGFQGDWTSPETGDVWMGARWYTPTTATFNNRDTVFGELATPVSLNRYTYANNNPLRYFDPDGRFGLDGFTSVQGAINNNAHYSTPPANVETADPPALSWLTGVTPQDVLDLKALIDAGADNTGAATAGTSAASQSSPVGLSSETFDGVVAATSGYGYPQPPVAVGQSAATRLAVENGWDDLVADVAAITPDYFGACGAIGGQLGVLVGVAAESSGCALFTSDGVYLVASAGAGVVSAGASAEATVRGVAGYGEIGGGAWCGTAAGGVLIVRSIFSYETEEDYWGNGPYHSGTVGYGCYAGPLSC